MLADQGHPPAFCTSSPATAFGLSAQWNVKRKGGLADEIRELSEILQRACGVARRHGGAMLLAALCAAIFATTIVVLGAFVLRYIPLGLDGLLVAAAVLLVQSTLLILLAATALGADADRSEVEWDDEPDWLMIFGAVGSAILNTLHRFRIDTTDVAHVLKPHLLALALVVLGAPAIMFTGSGGPITAAIAVAAAGLYSLCVMAALTSRDRWGVGTAFYLLQTRSPQTWVLFLGSIALATGVTLAGALLPFGGVAGWCVGTVLLTCGSLAVVEVGSGTDLGRTRPSPRRAIAAVPAAATVPQPANDEQAIAAPLSTPPPPPESGSLNLAPTHDAPAGAWVHCPCAGTLTLATGWDGEGPVQLHVATADGAWYGVPELQSPNRVELPVADAGWLWIQVAPRPNPQSVQVTWWLEPAPGTLAVAA